MNRIWLAAIAVMLGAQGALAQGDGVGDGNGREKPREAFRRKEMPERPGAGKEMGKEMEPGERMLAGRFGDGELLERLLENPRLGHELGLTEEQLGRIRTAMQELRAEHLKLREQMEKAAIEQAEIMTAPEVDEQKLLAAVEKTGTVRTEIAKLRIRQLMLVKKTLTPEQLEKARQLRQRFMEQWREGRGEGRREGRGEGGQGRGEGEKGEGGGGRKEWKEGRPGEAGELLKERIRKRREEARGKVTHDAPGDEVDPQDPNR